MAVRIPVYEDRLTPQGGINVQARGVEVSDAVGRSMQQLGNTAASMAGVQMEILRRKEDADSVANLSEPLAQNDAYWPTRLEQLAQSSKDGGIVEDQDGNRVTLTAQLTKEFSDFRKTFVEGTANEKARQLAQQHLAGLEGRLLRASMQTEAHLGVQNRSDKVEQSVDTWAKLAAKNPTMADQLVQSAFTMIANSGFDEHTRNQKGLAAQKMIVESALTGAIQTKPGIVKSAIDRHFTGGFEGAVNFTLAQEGGYVANDAGKGESNFGINKTANPEVDVKNLTRDQAKEIYRTKYWNAIGGDELAQQNSALAKVAFDTAVNMGAATAKDLLAKAGGDVNKLLDLRQARYDDLVKKNPQKFGQYEAGWKKRVGDLRADVAEATSPEATSVSSLVTKLDPSRVTAFENAATTEVNRQQAVVRSQVSTLENDQVAAYMNGDSVQKPLTEADYVKAYGAIDGAQRYANFQSIATMGSDMTAMKLQTPEQMMATVERYKPDPSKPGYDLANKRYANVVQAADRINAARQADPMAYAQQAGIGQAKPLPFNDQAAFGAELSKRTGVASTMQQTYGAPYTLLTKAEATTLNQGFERMTSEQRVGYLQTIRKSVTDPVAYRSIMGQIAPDSPVTAMAGMILSKQNPVIVKGWTSDTVYAQRDVASIMLEGEALLNPSKGAKGEDGKGKAFPMPKEQDMRDQFTSAMGKAFAGDPNGANFAYQAVKAYYAGQSSRDGDISGTINSGRMKDAITAVTGGVTDINGKGEVIRPWGMSDERFKNGAKAAFDQAINTAGYKGSELDVWGAYGLQNAGDGKYLLRSGTGYLTDKTGSPIVLDLTEPPSLVDQIPTGRSQTPMTPPATVKPEKMAKPNTQTPNTK